MKVLGRDEDENLFGESGDDGGNFAREERGMLTGTSLDLSPFGAVLTGIGLLYWLLLAAVIALIWRRVKGNVRKWIGIGVVLAVMVGPVGLHVVERQAQAREYKSRLDAATARFELLCKRAGEKILRTVEDVDGVAWMKWRSSSPNHNDQFKLDDPYGSDCSGEECLLRLLKVTKGADLNREDAQRHSRGYSFVETVDPSDGKKYRYIAVMKPGPSWSAEAIEKHTKATGKPLESFNYLASLEREPIDRFTVRYGITWDDISTREDREKWIAGGSIKVVDLQTSEVIAERVGFMLDKGLGSQAGFRSPWFFAIQSACPEFPHEPNDLRRVRTLNETRDFAFRTLTPTKGKRE